MTLKGTIRTCQTSISVGIRVRCVFCQILQLAHTYFSPHFKILQCIWMTSCHWVPIEMCFFSVRQVVQVAHSTAHTFPAVFASILHNNEFNPEPSHVFFLEQVLWERKSSSTSSLPQGRRRTHHANTWPMCQLLSCCWYRRMWWAIWWPGGGQAWSWNPAIKEMKRGDKQKGVTW